MPQRAGEGGPISVPRVAIDMTVPSLCRKRDPDADAAAGVYRVSGPGLRRRRLMPRLAHGMSRGSSLCHLLQFHLHVPQGPDRQSRRDRRARHPHAARDGDRQRWRSIPTPTAPSLHVRMADEAAHVGPAPPPKATCASTASWTRRAGTAPTPSIPGYGFLSENADFAAACEAAGIVFIGPSSASIRAMGSKTAARRTAIAAGAPVDPGHRSRRSRSTTLREFAATHGYPGAAQGGGRRRRQGHAPRGPRGAIWKPRSATRRREAERAFRSRRDLRRAADRARRGTSRSSCSATATATWSTWASASARSSGAIRR